MTDKCRFPSRDQPVPAQARRHFARTALRLALFAFAAMTSMVEAGVAQPSCSTAAASPSGPAMLAVGHLRIAIVQTGARVSVREIANGARAAGQRQPEVTLSLRPAPRNSALVSPGVADPQMGAGRIGDMHVMILSRNDRLLFALAARPSEVHFAVFQQEQGDRAAAESRLIAVERLYSDVFRQAPTSRFVFSGLPGAASGSGSQAVALDAIARARACLLQQLPPDTHLKPLRWETASVALLARERHDDKRVSASVHDGKARPVPGAMVAFARGEHLACDARTNGDGVATCRLFDVHGDDEHEAAGGTTVVTFAGARRPHSFLLPRTLVAKSSPHRR